MAASRSAAAPFATLAERPSSDVRALVARAAAGEHRAVRELVTSLMPDAFRVAVTILGAKHADLDDAVQLGVVAVMKQLPAFRGESSFRSYAMLIVSRTATAVRRRSRRGAELTDKFRAVEGIDDEEEVVDESEPVDQGLRRVMSELLATLPDAQAETLLLRVLLEYELTEVATETGVPVNTVRSRLRLAREALRRRIQGDPRLAALIEDGAISALTKGRSDDE